MRSLIIGAFLTGAFLATSNAPASAQYRFDPRIDPSNCYWREICDYGGRAIIRVRHHACPLVVEEHTRPDGTIVAVRTRRCGAVVRVRLP